MSKAQGQMPGRGEWITYSLCHLFPCAHPDWRMPRRCSVTAKCFVAAGCPELRSCAFGQVGISVLFSKHASCLFYWTLPFFRIQSTGTFTACCPSHESRGIHHSRRPPCQHDLLGNKSANSPEMLPQQTEAFSIINPNHCRFGLKSIVKNVRLIWETSYGYVILMFFEK
jgi:hypothetical protein